LRLVLQTCLYLHAAESRCLRRGSSGSLASRRKPRGAIGATKASASGSGSGRPSPARLRRLARRRSSWSRQILSLLHYEGQDWWPAVIGAEVSRLARLVWADQQPAGALDTCAAPHTRPPGRTLGKCAAQCGQTAHLPSRQDIPTPAPRRRCGEEHRDGVAGGARGCGEEHRDGAGTVPGWCGGRCQGVR
jgi:hypothetical protein